MTWYLTDRLEKAIRENSFNNFTSEGSQEVWFSADQKTILDTDIDVLTRTYNALFNEGGKNLNKISFTEARKIDGMADNIRILNFINPHNK